MLFEYLLAEKALLDIVIYDQRDSIGGRWDSASLSTKRQESINWNLQHCSVVNTIAVIMVNLPKLSTPRKQLASYADAFFQTRRSPKGGSCSLGEESCCNNCEIMRARLVQLIGLDRQVVGVRLASGNGCHGWQITTGAMGERHGKVTGLDAVVTANGFSERTLLPNIEGPDVLGRVLLVGDGPPSADIGHQIAGVCMYPLLAAQREQSLYHTDKPYTHDYPILVALMPDERGVNSKTEASNVLLIPLFYTLDTHISFCTYFRSIWQSKMEGVPAPVVWCPRCDAKCEIGEKALFVSEELGSVLCFDASSRLGIHEGNVRLVP